MNDELKAKKEAGKAKYLKRYARIGAKKAPKTRWSDRQHAVIADATYQFGVTPTDHAYRSKPDHKSRAVSISMVVDAMNSKTKAYIDKLLGRNKDKDEDEDKDNK